MKTLRRILFVNEDGQDIVEILKDGLFQRIDFERMAGGVIANKRNPLDYDVAIIDASDDTQVLNIPTLSIYLKAKNPDMLIIGTSIQGEYFREDTIAKQLYDERVSTLLVLPEDIEQLKQLIRNHGFTFSNNGGNGK